MELRDKEEIMCKERIDVVNTIGLRSYTAYLYVTNQRIVVDRLLGSDSYEYDDIINYGTYKVFKIMNTGFYLNLRDGSIKRYASLKRNKIITALKEYVKEETKL